MHVTFMFTEGGINNLREREKCLYPDVRCGHLGFDVSSIKRLDTGCAGKEI